MPAQIHIDTGAATAIDVHVHIEVDDTGHTSMGGELLDASAACFRSVHRTPTVDEIAAGWSPKYFPPNLVRYANSLLQDKVLFGSDFPVITPDRWLADFERLDIKPEVRPKILKHNACRLLGLT